MFSWLVGGFGCLKSGTVDDLVVDDELAATVVDDEGTDGATALGKGIGDAVEEVALVDDTETLLNVTGLGHGDDAVVVTHVEDTVGLVDGAEHALDDDRWGWVGDEAGLLMELAGEEVDTEVTVLAGLLGNGDTDNLARAALEDQKVADADEVAGDGDGVWWVSTTGLDNADVFTWDNLIGAALVRNDSIFVSLVVVVMVAVMEWVQHALGSTLDSAAEGVVLTFVVVVTHFGFGVLLLNYAVIGDEVEGI